MGAKMRENLQQWDFVIASYAISFVVIAGLCLWAWRAMRRAEKRRDEAKGKRANEG